VIEAERAFARFAEERGVGPAFRTFVADDAIAFTPDPVPAKPLFRGDPPGTLEWWPVYAGIAASGDLGFTTGPFVSGHGREERYGHYFTIWRRQADGTWRWVLDQGPPTEKASPLGRDTAVATLPPGEPAGGDGDGAWDDLLKTEERLARSLHEHAPRALQAVLADDARVMRAGPQPAVGRAAFAERLESGPKALETAHLGGAVSAAGDLGYTYGRALWSEAGSPVPGHYIRVWQRRAGEWKLIVDTVLPNPPPPKRQPG
jgi:ketosteroid isomerase-like protein